MLQEFRGSPREVAGLSKLATEIGGDIRAVATYVREYGYYESEGQILRSASSVLSAYCTLASDRLADRVLECEDIGIELNRAAWLYDTSEAENYELLNLNIVHPDGQWSSTVPEPGRARNYPSAAAYSRAEEPTLPAPDPPADDLAQVIRDATDWLGDVDGAIADTIGRSPVQTIMLPISGNWNVLRSVGAAYATAGEAMRVGADNLAAGVRQVDPHWDGRAAVAFTEHAGLVEKAIRAEQPVGEMIDMMLNLAADKIRDGIGHIISTFEDELARLVEVDNGYEAVRLVLKRLSGWVGATITVYEIAQILHNAYNRAMELKESIERVVDSIRTALDFLSDPAERTEQFVRDKLSPVLEPIGEAAEKARIVQTVMAGGEGAIDIAEAPDEPYTTGFGTQPWQDAT
ncbi:hypothetical protein [Millisia brevis]|uniref:hypothetical protein n=1 Tax=Millisia brevis TaxID=264148 RepID=UPI000A7657BA|nr:hypothetical protein [Millisia brevis]